MNSIAQLEAIFFTALEKSSPEEQRAYLDEACAGKASLRARVENMLAAQRGAGNFLESPPSAVVVEGSEANSSFRPITEGPGTQIGQYKLLEQIGEGGFGVVYMAEQEEPVRRKVALKIIKPGMDTRQVIARFESERQALALMEHPNIAKVLDAGTTGESSRHAPRAVAEDGSARPTAKLFGAGLRPRRSAEPANNAAPAAPSTRCPSPGPASAPRTTACSGRWRSERARLR